MSNQTQLVIEMKICPQHNSTFHLNRLKQGIENDFIFSIGIYFFFGQHEITINEMQMKFILIKVIDESKC